MAKKEVEENSFSRFKQVLLDKITEFLKNSLETFKDNILSKIQEFSIKIEKRILRDLYIIFIMILGTIFLFLSFALFLNSYWEWSYAWSFFSMGILLFILAPLINYFLRK